MARNEIIGMKELERSIKALGKVPQAAVTKAARNGAAIARKAAKANAPKDIGNLKRGIISRAKKTQKRGMKVFDVRINPAMSDIFVKVAADGKRSYYPASQEFGFMTVDGKYVQGKHFMKRSITENARVIEETIVDVMSKEIDKEIGKKG